MNGLKNFGESFAGHVGVAVAERATGTSRCTLALAPWHFNGHRVAHGGVLFTLVDTAMGAALYSTLGEGELCATIDIQISYLSPVTRGPLVCAAELVKRGKRVAHLQARVSVADTLVATATGNFAIFTPKPDALSAPSVLSALATGS